MPPCRRAARGTWRRSGWRGDCVRKPHSVSWLTVMAFAVYSTSLRGQEFVWTQTSPPRLPWTSIASSSDGAKIVVGSSTGGIYTSTNSGATWSLARAANGCDCVVSSSDGTKLALGIPSPRPPTGPNGWWLESRERIEVAPAGCWFERDAERVLVANCVEMWPRSPTTKTC